MYTKEIVKMVFSVLVVLIVLLVIVNYFGNKAGEKVLLNRAKQGDVEAQFALYQIYSTNPAESDKAIEFLIGSAARGYTIAQVELGKKLMDGSDIAKDPPKAVYWFEKAAKLRSVDALYELGRCFLSGKGVQKNVNQALTNFQQAADLGHAEAQCELGRCYSTGEGVKIDRSQTIYWCRKASENGSKNASEIIGYNAAELNERIPNSAKAFIRCCDELFMNGYKLSRFNSGRTKYTDWVNYAQTVVFDNADNRLGDIMFYSHALNFCFIDHYYCMRHLTDWNKSAGRTFCHMIELDEAGVLISTSTPWSEAVPYWLRICAGALRVGFHIRDPQWVQDYQNARQYVNAAF